jgi:hypothetical protein
MGKNGQSIDTGNMGKNGQSIDTGNMGKQEWTIHRHRQHGETRVCRDIFVIGMSILSLSSIYILEYGSVPTE